MHCQSLRPFTQSLSALGLILVVLLWAAPAHAQQTPVQRHGQLRVEGNKIVDQHGEPVTLRGMSYFWSQWMPQFYNPQTVQWLKDDWNATIIRAAMAVDHDGYIQNPQREMEKVKTLIDAAIDQGLYIIIDWHDHAAHEHLDHARTFFTEIAKTYGDTPNIIYETWNEPLNRHDWSTVIKPYHEAIIPVIREHDPDNLIILGTQTWSQDVDKAAADPVEGKNLAYTLHFYAATHKQWLRDKAQKALDAGIPLMVTEWGTSEANGNGKLDHVETQAWFEFMDKNHLSWCNWSIADKAETSAALRPGASATGNWEPQEISPSGRLVRLELRKKNPGTEESAHNE